MLTISHNYFNVTPNKKTPKDAGQPFDKKRYVFGIILLLLVDVLWVVSSELTKYIYTEIKLERPFLVTYLRSSFLFIYLLVLCFTPPTKDPCQPADYTQLLETATENEEETFYNEANNSLGDSTFVPVRAGETTDSDDAAPRAVRFNKVAEVRVMSAAMAGEALLARLSWAASLRASETAQRRAAAAATRRHLRCAALLAVPWFISNYLYRLGLLHTSSTAATTYLTTCSAFALAFGAIFAQGPHDRLTAVKCAAILLSTAGLVLLGAVEQSRGDWTAVLASVGAAFTYALYLVLFRRELRKSDGINSPLLAGLVGLACVCGAWALGALLGAAGGERAELPPARLALWLLLDAAIGPLMHEALWLWGYSLTTPRTASTTLALSAPLALAVEVWRGGGGYAHAGSVALAVGGWVAAGGAVGGTDSSSACDALAWFRVRWRNGPGFSSLRTIPDLDEQSEALISEEPT